MALWDIVGSRLIDDAEIMNRYRYWLRFVYSVADAVPSIVTVVNFKSLASAVDSRGPTRIKDLLIQEQRNFPSTHLQFVGTPFLTDVINAHQIYCMLSALLLPAIGALDVSALPMPSCVDEAIKQKAEWPKAATELHLRHEWILPMLRSMASLRSGNHAQEINFAAISSGTGDFADDAFVDEEHWELALNVLCDFIVERLCLLGELVLVKSENGISWAITDTNWLTSSVLGQIIIPQSLAEGRGNRRSLSCEAPTGRKSLATAGLSSSMSICNSSTPSKAYGEYLLSLADMQSRIGSTEIFESVGHSAEMLPYLLEAIGVCIPVGTAPPALVAMRSTLDSPKEYHPDGNPTIKYWFPSFIEEKKKKTTVS